MLYQSKLDSYRHVKQKWGKIWVIDVKHGMLSSTQHLFLGHTHDFWLAVHGKPVLFWKDISGLKFPCFQFYAC